MFGLKKRSHVGTSIEDLRNPAPLIANFFDRDWYLETYPDVASSGLDPWLHYLEIGAREGRLPGPSVGPQASAIGRLRDEPQPGAAHGIAFPRGQGERDRHAALRVHIDKSSKVLEIGPLANPIAPKREGYRSYVVDNADREELLRRYEAHKGVDAGRIEEVDFVWRDGDILSAIPAEHHQTFDAILVSHVIEHIPDPISFLQSLQKLIGIGGYVSLALPDKRFCFDYFRPPTTTGAWLEAAEQNCAVHSRRTLFEFRSMAVARAGQITWGADRFSASDMTFAGSALQDAYKEFAASGSVAHSAYIDAHAWMFTPSSFTLIANECHALGLTSLVPESVSTRTGGEFFVHLRLAYRRQISHHERIQLLALGAQEQMAGFRGVQPAHKQMLKLVANKFIGLFAGGI